MPLSYYSFVLLEYQAAQDKSRWQNIVDFTASYHAMHGFAPWLETLRNETLSLSFVNRLGETYMRLGQREPGEIPSILGLLCRLYDVELPSDHRLFTVEYWENLRPSSRHHPHTARNSGAIHVPSFA